ncbi:hypothetical protein VZ94_11115 [Methylocucumis oryzae]|uniref:Uncharacterized protein n=1 Tax=Methylocucumis oryzae TaxID=1632867 RepID=A0A0F3IIF8_9GAMM|nr:hypothetical protein VZ94_11115 [Methylocucumis oryzae]
MNGKAIKKYVIDAYLTDDLLYIENIETFENLPQSIQVYLLGHKHFLENRADKKRRKTSKWWTYSFPMHKEYYHLDKNLDLLSRGF